MSEKRLVDESFDVDADDVTLAQFMAELNEGIAAVDATQPVHPVKVCSSQYGGGQIYIKWKRLETDAEFAARIERNRVVAASNAEYLEAKERAEYERLKKKYGDG